MAYPGNCQGLNAVADWYSELYGPGKALDPKK